MSRERYRHKHRVPIFDSVLDRPRVVIHAFTKAELGVPCVEFSIDGDMTNLTWQQAERIGVGLIQASAYARGTKKPGPTGPGGGMRSAFSREEKPPRILEAGRGAKDA